MVAAVGFGIQHQGSGEAVELSGGASLMRLCSACSVWLFGRVACSPETRLKIINRTFLRVLTGIMTCFPLLRCSVLMVERVVFNKEYVYLHIQPEGTITLWYSLWKSPFPKQPLLLSSKIQLLTGNRSGLINVALSLISMFLNRSKVVLRMSALSWTITLQGIRS